MSKKKDKNRRYDVIAVLSNGSSPSKTLYEEINNELGNSFDTRLHHAKENYFEEIKTKSIIEDEYSPDLAIIILSEDDFKKENQIEYQRNLGHALTEIAFVYYAEYLLEKIGDKKVFVVFPISLKPSLKYILKNEEIELIEYDNSIADVNTVYKTVCDKIKEKAGQVLDDFESAKPNKPSNVTDLNVQYDIQILNDHGDALIAKKIFFKVNANELPERKHTIFSDTSSQEFDEIQLVAWNEKREILDIDRDRALEKDRKKFFAVKFDRALYRNDEYTYYIKFEWKRFFNREGSFFKVKISSDKVIFNIIFPSYRKLNNLLCIKKGHDEDEEEIKELDLGKVKISSYSSAFQNYKLEFKKLEPAKWNTIEINWKWE